MGEKTLKTANGNNQKPEDQGFYQAPGDIFHLGGGNHPIIVGPGINPQ
jgi:hypothetical protein